MKGLTLIFKRAKKEGFSEPQFSVTATSSAITMGSPSQAQEINPQSLEQGEEQAENLPQTHESHDPAVESDAFKPPQPDPDHEIVPDQQEEEEAEEDQDNTGLSAFPPAPSLGSNVSDVAISSSSYNPGKRGNKRKKGKGITSIKKQQAIEKKKQTLLEKLNPVPFIPSKILDFDKYEKLLKRLGLWDFVHIEFERSNIRVDLIAQLVATYDPKLRCSYVNECRILVNRADLARAFKLPVKKEKSSSVVVDGVDFDCEALSEESIAFVEDFVSNWVLLHEDTWMMPGEVLNWTKAIKDGHPEKLDWAGLFWFMVEKELTKGEQLIDCYYASHLQYLIKSQREEVLRREAEEVVLREDPEKVDLGEEPQNMDLDEELKEDGGGGNEGNVRTGNGSEVQEEEDGLLAGPNVELTLGPDAREEGTKDAEMVDVEESKDDDEEQEQEHEQQRWLLHGKNDGGQHVMQRCSMEEQRGLDVLDEGKEEDDGVEVEDEEGEEGEGEDGFDVVPGEYASVGGEGLTGNFLQAMETTQIPFVSQGHLHDQSSVDLLASRNDLQHMAAVGPSFYIHNGKREIDEVSHHGLNGSNKRLRIDGPWDHRPSDIGACLDQMQQLLESTRMMYEEKKQVLEDSNLQKQIIVSEVQKRDAVIEHLHKTQCEEIQKRDMEIFRLRRELYLMGNLVEEYRNALKESDRAFAEYRQQHQLAEEPIYQDAGPGGVMLTTAEIEKQRLQQEEYRNNCSILEQMVKETGEAFEAQFCDHLEKVVPLEKRLEVVSRDFKELRNSYLKSKVPETDEKVPETQEKVPDIDEKVPETDEKVPEASECPPTD